MFDRDMFDRDLAIEAQQRARQLPVVGILGPRQSGKTTLARYAFPDHHYVSLEMPNTRAFALSEPLDFLKSVLNAHGVIIDEAQHAPELFSYIQTIVDEKQQPGQFILTGSQNFHLNARISQSLAGRIALLTLLPLSMRELALGKQLPDDYETLLFQGGYPRIYASKIPPLKWYPDYIETYVERDIKQLKNIGDLSTFQKFMRLCAGRTGQLLNLSELGRDAGIDFKTVRSWLSLLEASYVVFFLQPHYKNYNKRLVKSPKLYFYDTGVACSLLGIESAKQLETHYLKGALFESLMIIELMKNQFNVGKRARLSFWRDKTGHELDCLFESQGVMRAIEMKSSRTIASDFFNGLDYWQKLSGNSAETSFLIYGGEETQKRAKGTALSWKHIDSIQAPSEDTRV